MATWNQSRRGTSPDDARHRARARRRQGAHAVAAVGQDRDRRVPRQPLGAQHHAQAAPRRLILAAHQTEVTAVPLRGHRLADDDLELLLLVMPVADVPAVEPDQERLVGTGRLLRLSAVTLL